MEIVSIDKIAKTADEIGSAGSIANGAVIQFYTAKDVEVKDVPATDTLRAYKTVNLIIDKVEFRVSRSIYNHLQAKAKELNASAIKVLSYAPKVVKGQYDFSACKYEAL